MPFLLFLKRHSQKKTTSFPKKHTTSSHLESKSKFKTRSIWENFLAVFCTFTSLRRRILSEAGDDVGPWLGGGFLNLLLVIYNKGIQKSHGINFPAFFLFHQEMWRNTEPPEVCFSKIQPLKNDGKGRLLSFLGWLVFRGFCC